LAATWPAGWRSTRTQRASPRSALKSTTAPSPDPRAWLREAISVANTTVHEQRKLAGTNMGTTIVMAVVANGQAYFANVGDSRGYLVNASGIKQMSVDHSLVQRLVDTKQLTSEEAHSYFQKNVIYKNLGDRATVAPDRLLLSICT
jgi:protein phosphatase